MNTALLQHCQSMVNRAKAGDTSARAKIADLKRRAEAGDQRAAMAYNTMAALYWQASSAPRWSWAEMFYAKLAANDAVAWNEVRQLKNLADLGDETALAKFRSLKAAHKKRKVSVWYPGAPSPRGYGMPNMNRAGIEVPGMQPAHQLPPGQVRKVLTRDAAVSILALIQSALPIPALPAGR